MIARRSRRLGRLGVCGDGDTASAGGSGDAAPQAAREGATSGGCGVQSGVRATSDWGGAYDRTDAPLSSSSAPRSAPSQAHGTSVCSRGAGEPLHGTKPPVRDRGREGAVRSHPLFCTLTSSECPQNLCAALSPAAWLIVKTVCWSRVSNWNLRGTERNIAWLEAAHRPTSDVG